MTKGIIFLIGVSGCGKTTIGHRLAQLSGWPFYDGDDFHPPANVDKMRSGIPLADADRQPWLEAINAFAREEMGEKGILACSALKKKYRATLKEGIPDPVHFILLDGSFELIAGRLAMRKGHYMPADLLRSQFDALELSNDLINVDIGLTESEITETIMEKLAMHKQFGLMGLGVMGKSLARNLARNGVTLSLYNRHVEGLEVDVARRFVKAFPELENAAGFDGLEPFVASLERPRRILLMLTAGRPVDMMIEKLLPLLSEGDAIADGGNTHYKDTQRRQEALAKNGILYLGCGVSGGEKGALEGPSIMPGGSPEAYALFRKDLLKIAARDNRGEACITYIGHGGAGHFVKMVHNGIEYAEMQLLTEIYDLFRNGFDMSQNQIAEILQRWQQGDLQSYLLGITIDILRKKEGDRLLLDLILDKAANKGTGSWTTIAACELGVPIPTISSALFARYVSAFKSERIIAQALYEPSYGKQTLSDDLIATLENAYRCARIVNHHQGVHLIAAASKTYGWDIALNEVARIWTSGCIIRSTLMQELSTILASDDRILLNAAIQKVISRDFDALRRAVALAARLHLAVPCLGSSLHFFTAYTREKSPANLLQAQRDYFGAHTYKRIDDPEGQAHHTDWSLK